MKKLALIILSISMLSSCVSKKIYTELEEKYDKLRGSNESLFAENQDLIDQKKALQESKIKLQSEVDKLASERERITNAVNQLEDKKRNLEAEYENLANDSEQQLSAKAEENRRLLVQLQEKESQLASESERLEQLQSELSERSARVDQLEGLIAAKEAAMQRLKDAVSSALQGFEGKGLTVERKNGKVYVSMENKLLFSSGSWAVNGEGQRAVENLASVLKDNPDINVLIEGHTDNVPYGGKGVLLDNWDLSTKRATAIVRILVNNNVNAEQVTAAGRSKYVPLTSNATSTGKAKNRRIEIILAPNLDAINDLLEE
ncbi:MAG TPA: cell envelope biogenesis protein OmpA [Flavobacteriaceae bacterium]|nr:cell envelope biogenesis protein OmpA [Flavobacteriaceae bacterium]